MKEKELRLRIISELVEFHNKIGYRSEDLDEDVMQMVVDHEMSNEDLELMRNEMWIEYIRLLLENIDSLLSCLLKNFVEIEKIKKFHIKFKELQERYENLDISSDIDEIKNLFENSFNLYKNIMREEKILKRSGIERFRLKIFPIYAGLITTLYGALQYFYLRLNLSIATIIWILLIVSIYYLLQLWWRRGLDTKKGVSS